MLSSVKYGAKIRKLFKRSVASQRELYVCTKCGKKKVRRKMYAVWACKSCGSRFAGGAYAFQTEGGIIAQRMLNEQAE